MDDAANLRQWTNLVRRARLGAHTTAVALCVATYADADGSRVYPGIARLAFDVELSYTTVKRSLAKLREAGLIRKVGRHGDADAYRLIFADDLLERVEVPTPAQVDVHLAAVRKRAKGTYVPKLRLSSGTADDEIEADLRTSSGAADKNSAALQEDRTGESAALSDTICGSPGRAATVQDRVTNYTIHSDEDLLADVTTSRAQGREQDQISPNRPPRELCPHGRSRRTNRRGEPRCEQCRADETAPPVVAEPIPVPIVTAPGQFKKARCETHGLPAATCTFCRRERRAA